ncbi:MAG TPA: hypothetical protein VNN76_06960 [Bacteroidota bacterium]|nr:hypothetical protein [Bacteroidota bacterium]
MRQAFLHEPITKKKMAAELGEAHTQRPWGILRILRAQDAQKVTN